LFAPDYLFEIPKYYRQEIFVNKKEHFIYCFYVSKYGGCGFLTQSFPDEENRFIYRTFDIDTSPFFDVFWGMFRRLLSEDMQFRVFDKPFSARATPALSRGTASDR
jgi:hypothetical protein